MSDFYGEMREVATEVLTEFNQGKVEFIKMVPATGGTPDAPAAPVPTPYTLQGAVVKGVGYQLLKDAHIAATDLEVIGNVIDGVVPDENDFVDIDGVRHKIVRAPKIPGAGTQVVWKFVVRSGG